MQQHDLQWPLGEKTLLNGKRITVNALETGKYDLSLSLTFKIARIFQLPIEEIFQYDPELDSRRI